MAESPEISVVIGDQCCNVTIISLLRDITMGILGKLKARDWSDTVVKKLCPPSLCTLPDCSDMPWPYFITISKESAAFTAGILQERTLWRNNSRDFKLPRGEGRTIRNKSSNNLHIKIILVFIWDIAFILKYIWYFKRYRNSFAWSHSSQWVTLETFVLLKQHQR